MPIKPKIEIKVEKMRIDVPAPLRAEVEAYARFLGGATTPDYVFTEAVKREMRSNRAFQESRRAAPAPRTATSRNEPVANAAAGARTASHS